MPNDIPREHWQQVSAAVEHIDEMYEELVDSTFQPVGADIGNGTLGPRVTTGLPPARTLPVVTRLESADLVHRICVHEFAEGLALANGADPLEPVPDGYLRIAQSALDFIRELPHCPTKGAR